MVVPSLAVVSDKLEAANHLANGEETQHLSEQDSSADNLCGGDVTDLVDGR